MGGRKSAHTSSKIATVSKMAAVLWVLSKLDDFLKLGQQWHYGICVAAALLTGVSGLIYLVEGMRLLAKHPSSSPSKDGDKRETNFPENH